LAWLRNRLSTSPRDAVVALLASCLLVFGVFVLVTATDNRTETLPARVSIFRSFSRFDRDPTVLFRFDDGSHDKDGRDGDPFFGAVRKFGAGTAQVTRNAENNSIYRVVFHGKSYTLSSAGDDRNGGIVAVVLALLGLAYAIWPRGRPRAGASASVSQ
jgi:hypothetical protein